MNSSYIGLVLTAVGLLANLVWTIINLRIEGRLERRFNDLKEYMEERYVCADLCEERFHAICRRLDKLRA